MDITIFEKISLDALNECIDDGISVNELDVIRKFIKKVNIKIGENTINKTQEELCL